MTVFSVQLVKCVSVCLFRWLGARCVILPQWRQDSLGGAWLQRLCCWLLCRKQVHLTAMSHLVCTWVDWSAARFYWLVVILSQSINLSVFYYISVLIEVILDQKYKTTTTKTCIFLYHTSLPTGLWTISLTIELIIIYQYYTKCLLHCYKH